MKKKNYQKPLMIIEKFTPHDYVSTCIVDSNIYHAGGHYYIDFSKDGICQANSEAVDENGNTNYQDGRNYSSVNIYQHQYQTLLGWDEVLRGYDSPNGHEYGDDWRTGLFNVVHYKLQLMDTQSLIIHNGKVYYNQS